MKFACLFSGIGALTQGLREAGHEPILLVELEASARQCLRAHFPGVELHGDIFEVHDLPHGTELMTAGFPCSYVSLNNQMDRKGKWFRSCCPPRPRKKTLLSTYNYFTSSNDL